MGYLNSAESSLPCTIEVPEINLTQINTTEDNKEITITPNPFNSYIEIDADFPIFDVKLYSISGEFIFSQKYSGYNNNQKIEFKNQNLSKGIYLININNNFSRLILKNGY